MKKFVCIMCGKVYEDDETDLRKKVRTCSKACYRKHKNIANRAYYYRQAQIREQLKEEERQKERKKEEKRKSEYSMAEINEMARAEGLTYGQMQGKLYCLKYPLIQRRGIR